MRTSYRRGISYGDQGSEGAPSWSTWGTTPVAVGVHGGLGPALEVVRHPRVGVGDQLHRGEVRVHGNAQVEEALRRKLLGTGAPGVHGSDAAGAHGRPDRTRRLLDGSGQGEFTVERRATGPAGLRDREADGRPADGEPVRSRDGPGRQPLSEALDQRVHTLDEVAPRPSGHWRTGVLAYWRSGCPLRHERTDHEGDTRPKSRPARSTPTTVPAASRVKKPRCPRRPPLVTMYSSSLPGSRPMDSGG